MYQDYYQMTKPENLKKHFYIGSALCFGYAICKGALMLANVETGFADDLDDVKLAGASFGGLFNLNLASKL